MHSRRSRVETPARNGCPCSHRPWRFVGSPLAIWGRRFPNPADWPATSPHHHGSVARRRLWRELALGAGSRWRVCWLRWSQARPCGCESQPRRLSPFYPSHPSPCPLHLSRPSPHPLRNLFPRPLPNRLPRMSQHLCRTLPACQWTATPNHRLRPRRNRRRHALGLPDRWCRVPLGGAAPAGVDPNAGKRGDKKLRKGNRGTEMSEEFE
jgi:hypothetical protein